MGARSLPVRRQTGKCRRGHLSLALVLEQPRGLLERNPLGRVDLVIVVPDAARAVPEQEERDHLEHPLAVALVPVAHVPELLDELAAHARFLAHLAGGGLRTSLAGIDPPLRQSEHRAALHADRGHEPAPAHAPHHHAAGRELANQPLTSGTKRTGTTRRSSPPRNTTRCSPPASRTGQTSAAPGASCSATACGGRSAATAVTSAPPNGARSGAPSVPSPVRTSTLS